MLRPITKRWPNLPGRLNSSGLTLPEGCFANYDLELIDFLKQLDSGGAQKEYEALRESLGRRPTLSEFYRSGASVSQGVRQQYGSWFSFVDAMGDLGADEKHVADRHGKFFREVETTPMTKSFKMVLLEALLEHDGLITASCLGRSGRTIVSHFPTAAQAYSGYQARSAKYGSGETYGVAAVLGKQSCQCLDWR